MFRSHLSLVLKPSTFANVWSLRPVQIPRRDCVNVLLLGVAGRSIDSSR